ncbi:MAG TPA: flippase activity-associated protein Agl23 [Opitutaceae bacterium]|nr:flippase activity-associated protein Agl23 [Opitutaceae bacterium]
MELARRWLPLALIAIAACWLRTKDIARRPMHADEANQAVKTGELLETGHYAFDPRDHHGPTLYYAALPIAWLRGEHTLAGLSETTVRLVPAVCGTMAVVLVALLAAPLGTWPALAAATFVAISPPAVYYSRYFVQETLLLTFTLGAFVCAREWWRNGRIGWLVGAGTCAGLMQATKASAPLFALAALLALLATRPARPSSPKPWRDLAAGALTALAVAALLYSSFGTNLRGLRDALGSYGLTGTRLAGETGHEKPWWYYAWLFGWHRAGGLFFHQIAFSALAIAGVIVAIFGRRLLAGDKPVPSPANPLLQRTAIYTLIIGVVLSAISYKTPWHAVHFVPGLAVLAAGALAGVARLRTGKFVGGAAAFLTAATLYQQTQLTSFARPADMRNPFAYVHSAPDVLKVRALAEAAVARSPGRPIRVIGEEYWPLPWYLRGLPGVGYWPTPPDDCDGAIIITSATQAGAVKSRLRAQYREAFLGLRPGFVCIVFTPEP